MIEEEEEEEDNEDLHVIDPELISNVYFQLLCEKN